MARVYLELKDNKWKEVEHSNFYIDRYLLSMLNNKHVQIKSNLF